MGDIRNVNKSGKNRNRRIIKLDPMTRAVRSVLAVSALTLGMGLAGNAAAASYKLPAAMVHALQAERPAIDVAPVFDLTAVPQDLTGPGAPVQSLIGDGTTPTPPAGHYYTWTSFVGTTSFGGSLSSAGDAHWVHGSTTTGSLAITNVHDVSVTSTGGEAVAFYQESATTNSIDNSGGLTVDGYTDAAGIVLFGAGDITVVNSGAIDVAAYLGNAYGILGASDAGDVDIGNTNGIGVYSHDGMAIGIYAYSTAGNASVDNSGAIDAYSYNGLADGIFASGANVDVANSGGITAEGYAWASGIEARANDAVQVANTGDIYASIYAIGGAYGIYASGHDATVANEAGITARGYYATGIRTQTYGDAGITNTGNIDAGTTTGSALAWGINAVASGEGAAIQVDNTGSIHAAAVYGASGIEGISTGAGGTVQVNNGGDIVVQQNRAITSYGGYGILASADGDASINNTGDILVTSRGPAFGLVGMSFSGEASVTNEGNVTVSSTVNSTGVTPTGLLAFGANGTAAVDNSGTVVATGVRRAAGIDASAYGDVSIDNSGDVSAYATGMFLNTRADGIKAVSGSGDITLDNSGSIYASGTTVGLGVYAVAENGSIAINNAVDGSIEAYSYYGVARGVFAYATHGDIAIDSAGAIDAYGWTRTYGVMALAPGGDAAVDSSGTVYARSGSNNATGVLASTDQGAASITNSGDIQVISRTGSYGVRAYGYAGADVGNSGSIHAASTNGVAVGMMAQAGDGNATVTNTGGSIEVKAATAAFGIFADSAYGDATVTNASEISALGVNSAATGIRVTAAGDVDIANSAYIYAASNGDAIGIYGYSLAADATIDNSGDITASSYYGLADGIFASGQDVAVTNSGAVSATSVYGDWAAGIEAQGSNSTQVSNTGDITASAMPFLQVEDGTSVLYSTGGGQVFGIYATAGAGNGVVTNSGSLVVQGGYATGIEAQSTGNLWVTNSGDIVAGTGLGAYYNSDNGYSYYYGTVVATGINASGNGEGMHVAVANTGDIAADGIFGASGISATASGLGGTAVVTNTGDITAAQYVAGGYGAFGIVASTDGDSGIDNGGAITVTSGGTGYGVAALSFAGDAVVVNSGDVGVEASTAASKYYGSYGLLAFAGNGYAAVDNSGSVSVSNGGIMAAPARAVDAQGQQGVGVVNSGALYADGKYAYGVFAVSAGGDVAVNNTADGDIGFYSYLGYGTGILGVSEGGDVAIGNAGAIAGYAYSQAAGIFGSASTGDVDVSNASTGSIDVVSAGFAVGIFARADYGTATIVNSGDISASVFPDTGYQGDVAYGLLATSDYGYAAAGNSGGIQVDGYYTATGIAARSLLGSTVSTAAGSHINATAYYVAIGIEGRAEGGDVTVGSAGDITTAGGYGSVGIQAYSAMGDVTVGNTGHITAASGYGIAIGATAYTMDGLATVTNNGLVEADGAMASYGILAQAYAGDVVVNVGSAGQVEASAGIAAFGVLANAGDGDATVNNAGKIHASGATYNFGVVFEGLYGANTLNNLATGVISADGDEGYAFAVAGNDGVETINNSGRILGAISLYGGDDVFSNKAGGTWDVGSTLSTDFGDGNDTLANAGGGTITLNAGQIAFGAGDDTINNAGLVRLVDSTITMGDGQAAPVPTLAMLPQAVEANAFNNSGTLKVVGSSVVDTVGGIFTNTGVIDFGNGVTTDALVLNGTLAGNGNIAVDVDFGDHTADHLLVDGDVASGAVQTVNVRFTGIPTLTAMETKVDVINVTGTSTNSNFVAGQVVGYNWNGNFLSLGAGIIGAVDSTNATNDVFSIGLTVEGLSDGGTLAANAASGAATFLNSQVGTFRQRLGVNPYGDAGKVLSAFMRVYTDQGDVNPTHTAGNFGQGGNFAYEQASWGREFGVNANLFGNFHAGVVMGNADSRQRLADGVGQNRMNGSTFGAYATWYVPEGLYVDLSGRWMGAEIRSESAGANLQSRARTNAVSLEAGYEWKLGGVNVVPQAQYIRTRVEDVRTFHGERLDFTVHGGTFTRGRLGVEVNGTFQSGDIRWTPYGSVSAIRDSGGKTAYSVGDFHGETGVRGSRTMAELGIGVQKGGFGFTLGANWLDGGSMKSFVGGQANVRYSW